MAGFSHRLLTVPSYSGLRPCAALSCMVTLGKRHPKKLPGYISQGCHSSSRDCHSSSQDCHSSSRDRHSSLRDRHSSSQGCHSSSQGCHSSSQGCHSSSQDCHSSLQGLMGLSQLQTVSRNGGHSGSRTSADSVPLSPSRTHSVLQSSRDPLPRSSAAILCRDPL